jgi:hypothetical protein
MLFKARLQALVLQPAQATLGRTSQCVDYVTPLVSLARIVQQVVVRLAQRLMLFKARRQALV